MKLSAMPNGLVATTVALCLATQHLMVIATSSSTSETFHTATAWDAFNATASRSTAASRLKGCNRVWHIDGSGLNMSILWFEKKCFEICQGESPNYTHFGLQYRIECWCGTDVDPEANAPQLDDSACDMTCATPSQICGGYLTMNVFEIKTFEGLNPRVGCFNDDIPRAMSATPKYASDQMTRAMCQQHCSEAGTEYYGLEYSTECWCGDEYDRYGEVVYERSGDIILSNCEEWYCAGNTLEQCGEAWLLAVYRTAVPLE